MGRSAPLKRLGAALSFTLPLGAMAVALAAGTNEPPAVITQPSAPVSQAQGLAAFGRIYEVVSHPRCANCHVGDEGVPMWSGPTYDRAYGGPQPHGMNVRAGASRDGSDYLACATCHRVDQDFSNSPHAPPRAGVGWQLPPAEFAWFGKDEAEICAQLSDPERTGGRDAVGLAQHLIEDSSHRGLVLWGWEPSGGREPAPHSLQVHVDDLVTWGAAGTPCPAVKEASR